MGLTEAVPLTVALPDSVGLVVGECEGLPVALLDPDTLTVPERVELAV